MTITDNIRSLVLTGRVKLAWKLSDIATPILRKANQLCEDVPCDFHAEWEDGRKYGQVATVRSIARTMIGEPAKAADVSKSGFTGSSTVDEIFDAGCDFERGAQR